MDGGVMITEEHDEMYVLGHLLDDNDHLAEVRTIIAAEDFGLLTHQAIFRVICEQVDAGQEANILSVAKWIQLHNRLDLSVAYVADLTTNLIVRDDKVRIARRVRGYAGCVADTARKRRLGEMLETVSEETRLPLGDIDETLARLEERTVELRTKKKSPQLWMEGTAQPFIEETIRKHLKRGLMGFLSGIVELDKLTNGIQVGEVTVVGARSGVGKSSLMMQVVVTACRAGRPVLVASLEMSKHAVMERVCATMCDVPYAIVRNPDKASADEMFAIEDAARRIEELPLRIIDDSAMAIDELVDEARLAVRRDGVRLVCVDYVQIVRAEGKDERLRVAAVSRGLTRLAKQENVAVMMLSQLARADRSNANRRPTIGDLRESSQIENDAHVVLLLHREWDDEKNRLATNCELIVAKQRAGETGLVTTTFNPRTLTFDGRKQA
jgi:replicative DNA helicase